VCGRREYGHRVE
jgi:hypothetical protein